MNCGKVHSLLDKYLAQDHQMMSADLSKFFIIPYGDMCSNKKIDWSKVRLLYWYHISHSQRCGSPC